MKDSVTNAPLVSLLLAKHPSGTPIGEAIITNTALIQAGIDAKRGQPITNLTLTQFETLGEEATQVYNNNGKIGYKNPNPANPHIIDIQFDKRFGVLSFVRSDQVVVEATDLPIQKSLGIGPEGKRGENGADGKSGYEGRSGSLGFTGCPGMPGKQGPQGEEGPPGDTGAEGKKADDGCEGVQGPIGMFGLAGRIGDDGPTGNDMPACFSPRGPRGPAGDAALNSVQFSSLKPTTNSCVWGELG
jgi:hypothetical protein